MTNVDLQLNELARDHAPRVLALLAGQFRDLDLADEAVQDSLVEAAKRWPTEGVPDNPPAWLNRVARRKAIDRRGGTTSALLRTIASAHELTADPNDSIPSNPMITDDPKLDPKLPDDQLRLIFLCCHPALNADSQVALTLRLIAGLTTEEIAAAFLVPTPTLAQRVSRAKAKVRDAGIPLAMPELLLDRIDAVLTVLYLVFNEGYLTRSDAAASHRVDLCDESLRLTVTLSQLLPEHAEVHGLLALELFHHARREARFDANMDLVLLPDQDRSQWHRDSIEAGNAELGRAMTLRSPGRYQLQAMIAGYHTNAASADETDWTTIANLYDALAITDPSPVVALNRAVAVGFAHGGQAGLDLLGDISDLQEYHLFHAARAELLVMTGNTAEATTAFHSACKMTENPAELRHLNSRLAELHTNR